MTAVEPIAPTSPGEAFAFTEADLTANRAGQLSEAQAVRLRRAWRTRLGWTALAVLLLIVLATGFLYLGRNGDAALRGIGGGLAFVNAVLVAFSARAYAQHQDDMQRPVRMTAAKAKRIIRVIRRSYVYVLRFEDDGRAFEQVVNKAMLNAVDDGKRYRVYRTAGTGQVLSLERGK